MDAVITYVDYIGPNGDIYAIGIIQQNERFKTPKTQGNMHKKNMPQVLLSQLQESAVHIPLYTHFPWALPGLFVGAP